MPPITKPTKPPTKGCIGLRFDNCIQAAARDIGENDESFANTPEVGSVWRSNLMCNE